MYKFSVFLRQQMRRVCFSIAVVVTLFSSALLAKSATFDPTTGVVSIPVIELQSETGASCYQVELLLMPNGSLSIQEIAPLASCPTQSSVMNATFNFGTGIAFFPVVDVQGVSEPCYQVELILVQDGTLSILTLVPVSCSQRPDDTIPVVSSISLQADPSISYQEIGLIGRDADGDTLDYELLAPASDAGYTSAYIPSQTPKLYVTLATDFSGTIVLPYRATDGQHFSEPANVTIEIRENTDEGGLGMQEPDPEVYSTFEVSRFSGDLFGAPGDAPTLPPSIDLSNNFPIPGDQGSQSSCVGWATAYALKSFQERVEEGWSLNTTEHLFSPAFIYNQINRGIDKGSLPGEALQLIVEKGAATLATMPYNQYDYTTQPSQEAFQEAANFKAAKLTRADSTLAIKEALANRLPVVVGIYLYGSFWQVNGSDAVYNSADGGFEGLHAVTLVGYDDTKYGGAFKVINSWGTDWGDGGYFWLPYQFAESQHSVYGQQKPILIIAYVLEDADNTGTPSPGPDTEPEPVGDLPNLQVESWNTSYDPRPGGEGILYYRIKNTGSGTASAGADVNLMLSPDPNISSNDIYVVYETIPFDLESGTAAYRDESNGISFKFPASLTTGDYYMAVWVDDLNVVQESNEDDNFSLGDGIVHIQDTLPDLVVKSWYASWNSSGDGTLKYEVINEGASATTTTDWDINLVLSEDQIIGNGNEWFLFYESGNYILQPGEFVYRDETSSAYFNLYITQEGNFVLPGVYYMAVWVDDLNKETESDESNNYSLGGNLVEILGSRSLGTRSPQMREAYNGKPLPQQVSMRKVQILETPEGGRSLRFLEAEVEKPLFSKQIRSADQVVFPTTKSISMPKIEKRQVRSGKKGFRQK